MTSHLTLSKNDLSIFCRTCHGLSNALYRLSLSFLVFGFSGGGGHPPPPPAVRRWLRPPAVRGSRDRNTTPDVQFSENSQQILSPYVPATYSLNSSAEFVDLIKSQGKRGMLTSVDSTSLFTNVPVEKTTDILVRYAYPTVDMDPPEVPQQLMKPLLWICTKRAPFISPRGDMYICTCRWTV